MKNRMNMFKKVIVTLGVVLSLGIVTGCSASSSGSGSKSEEEFYKYAEELVPEFVRGDDISLSILFNNPADYGIVQKPAVLGFIEDEAQEDLDVLEADDILQELKNYDVASFSENGKLQYDIFKEYLEKIEEYDFEELDSNYLGGFLGVQAQLPLILGMLEFNRVEDIEGYFHFLETLDAEFQAIATYEQERQDNGTGYNTLVLDAIIEQTVNYTANEVDPDILSAINTQIDEASFLSDAQKVEMKEKNESLLRNEYRNAYVNLGNTIKELNRNEEILGLATKPNGKEYFEYQIQKNTGIDMSVEEIEKYLDEKDKEAQNQVLEWAMKYQITDSAALEEMISNHTMSAFVNADEVMTYLNEMIQADFPEVPALNYEVLPVPSLMKDNFSPAAYLTSKIDAQEGEKQHIFLNGEYKDSDFTTIAHEGYPGHMYQDAYFKRLDVPTYRHLIDYTGYSEGWANFIENQAYDYAPSLDEATSELLKINDKFNKIFTLRLEIGVHNEGWTLEDLKSYLNEQGITGLEDEVLEQQYVTLLEKPGNYFNYYLNSMMYEDLQNKAKEELGSNYSNKDFYKVLLDTGPSSFSILEKEVETYISNNK